MDKYTIFVYLIFIIKIGFILTAVTHIYLKVKGKEKTDLDKKILYWKERFEFIFIAAMSVLLIYLFNPRRGEMVMIDADTKLLLYLFGFVLLITANWDDFFHQAT
jgi:uncharacterized membrane protein